jgi:assimilatory nitrate reductase catalytic subunit
MGHGAAFDFAGPADIFDEHARLSALDNDGARAFDVGGLVGADYASFAPVQWPVRPNGTARMFGDGQFQTFDRRGRFIAVAPPPPLRPSPGMLTLNTGRVRDHWHTMTRTGKTARLSAHLAEPFAEIHPADAARYGIRRASLVRLENAQGQVVVRALLSDRQRQGSVFVPMHWTDQFAANARVDTLVRAKTDPQSGQPALKMSEVAITPAGIRMYGFAVSAARPDLSGTDYWAMARADGGHRSELGWFTAPEDRTIWMQQAFGLSPDVELVSNRDERSGRFSFAAFSGEQLELALFISPDPVLVSRQWATTLLTQPVERARRAEILSGRPSADRPDTGAIVCACFSVGVNSIVGAIKGGCDTVEAVGAALKAGTNCGSCRSEIRAIIQAQGAAPREDAA